MLANRSLTSSRQCVRSLQSWSAERSPHHIYRVLYIIIAEVYCIHIRFVYIRRMPFWHRFNPNLCWRLREIILRIWVQLIRVAVCRNCYVSATNHSLTGLVSIIHCVSITQCRWIINLMSKYKCWYSLVFYISRLDVSIMLFSHFQNHIDHN